MKKLITLAVLALASTGAFADDVSTDILYGGTTVSASPSSPFVQTGPVNSELATDLVYGSDSRDHSHKAQLVERIVNVRQDISTDIIYGG